MVVWNAQQIITKIRNITGTPISSTGDTELSDETISDYINTYYTLVMPFELKEQINLQPITFQILPNQNTAVLPGTFLTDQPMAYVDGYPMIFYQDRDIYLQDWPTQFATDPVTNNGTAVYALNTQFFPLTQGTFVFTDGVQTVFDESDGLLHQVVGGVDTVVGAINYVTGAFNLTFNAVPAGTATIYDKYVPYQPARPQGILWYNNEFTFMPIPDQVYTITLQGYVNQNQLALAGSFPSQTEWGQLIAYGASLEIFADRGDLVAYENTFPILKRYENVALARTVQQYESVQSVPRF